MTVATGLGAIMGYGVDYYFATTPWGIGIGVVLGGAAGMLNVYHAAQSMTQEIDEIEKSDQDKNNDPE